MQTARSLYFSFFSSDSVPSPAPRSPAAQRRSKPRPPAAPARDRGRLSQPQADRTHQLARPDCGIARLQCLSPAVTRAKLIAHQTRARSEFCQIIKEYRAELSQTLTPEQRATLDKGMEKYRKQHSSAANAS